MVLQVEREDSSAGATTLPLAERMMLKVLEEKVSHPIMGLDSSWAREGWRWGSPV